MESAAACTSSRAPRLARTDAHGFPRALHDVFEHCTARPRPKIQQQIAIKVHTSPKKNPANRFRALGCTRLRSAEDTVPESRRRRPRLSHCHRKSTPPYARAAERAQALDVHCVLDPSNPSNPSDGAPLDQLCPSMRGCLSIRAAAIAHSAATHNKTSNAGTRSAARHQVAGQAQPPAAR